VRTGSYLLHKPFSNDDLLATITAALGPRPSVK
jgi:hypothetical protein